MNENEAILCRCAVQLSPTATGEMMYMPGGVQRITPVEGGIGAPIQVQVDAAGAALNAQVAAIKARNKRPYFDFNHEDGPASFWREVMSESSRPINFKPRECLPERRKYRFVRICLSSSALPLSSSSVGPTITNAA